MYIVTPRFVCCILPMMAKISMYYIAADFAHHSTESATLASLVSIMLKKPTSLVPKSSSTSNMRPSTATKDPPTTVNNPLNVRSTSYVNSPISVGSFDSPPPVYVLLNFISNIAPSSRLSSKDSLQVPEKDEKIGPSVRPTVTVMSLLSKMSEVHFSASSSSSN
mmetsp:Transcript_14903/g.22958  ORF Transcript_14903/g.22958 Transcript_14903/m.22958 type:complete len:164 (-) Transcript_14903:301-792(-)